MVMSTVFTKGMAVAAAVATATLVVLPPAPARAQDGLYAPEQAERGATLFAVQCISCHGALTAFVPEVAALLGDHTFRNRWSGRPLRELFELIQVEMPQDNPGSLSAAETADLVAYLLNGNRLGPGDRALSETPEQLTQPLFQP
jgi:mono/diheme cytochrome c family protein